MGSFAARSDRACQRAGSGNTRQHAFPATLSIAVTRELASAVASLPEALASCTLIQRAQRRFSRKAKRALPRCTVSFHHAINRNEGVAQDVQSAQYHQQARLCPATWWGIVLANLREAAQRHTGARPRPGELVSELGRVADVTRGMLALTVVALVGLFTANPDVPVGLSSDIVGEG
jgi:hypothetical protein